MNDAVNEDPDLGKEQVSPSGDKSEQDVVSTAVKKAAKKERTEKIEALRLNLNMSIHHSTLHTKPTV